MPTAPAIITARAMAIPEHHPPAAVPRGHCYGDNHRKRSGQQDEIADRPFDQRETPDLIATGTHPADYQGWRVGVTSSFDVFRRYWVRSKSAYRPVSREQVTPSEARRDEGPAGGAGPSYLALRPEGGFQPEQVQYDPYPASVEATCVTPSIGSGDAIA